MSPKIQLGWLLLIFALAVGADWLLIHLWRRYNQRKLAPAVPDPAKAGTAPEPPRRSRLTRFFAFLRGEHAAPPDPVRARWLTAIELCAIVIFGLIITHPYLDMDPEVIPGGREYLSAIQTHHLWLRFADCGACALWDGTRQGGAPAFVDPHGSMLHPLVIITTLIWGVLNGAKIGLVLIFIAAGMGQWWLARELGLGRAARLWSAGMAIAGGYLSARVELGTFGVALSQVACAFFLPAAVRFGRQASRANAALLGIVLASAILAGQGYMQVGLAFAAPSILLLLPWRTAQFTPALRRLGLALVIAVLLAGIFLLPSLHFLPEFGKTTDREFTLAQPFEYIPLNLVIRDPVFYRQDSLQKSPHVVLNANYLGWIAVALAIYVLSAQLNNANRRNRLFLLAGVLIPMWIASAQPLRWLVAHLPYTLAEFLAGVRNASQIAGLAGPAVIALAAMGADHLINRPWPDVWVTPPRAGAENAPLRLDLRWLLLIPLLYALNDVVTFSKNWITVARVDPGVYIVTDALKTVDLQWVNTPEGDHFYIENAASLGLKLRAGIRTWYWKDRPWPDAYLEASYRGAPPDMDFYHSINEAIKVYIARPGHEYARLEYPSGQPSLACTAQGSGGDITVRCPDSPAGSLIVMENQWSGWGASLDGRRLPLLPGQWLAVDLPAGEHTVQFRYRPWDVPLGLVFSLVGLALVVWAFSGNNPSIPQASSQSPRP